MLRAAMLLLFAGLVPICAEPLRSTQDGYARQVWHTEDGLPEETVQAFAQTPDHFLWIGTSGGLVRFDGAQFVVFNSDNTRAFRENSVFCLATARDGTLWIGTEGGGLISYKDGLFRAWSKTDGLTNGYIRALREHHNGDLWIGTDDGLFRMRRATIQRIDGRDGVPLSSIHAIYEDREHRLWAGGFHLLLFDNGKSNELLLPGGLTDNIKSIVETRDGTVWVGTVSGLERTIPGAGNPHFRRISQIQSTVRTLLEDNDGTLWIGTIGEGLIRYQNGNFSKLEPASQLPSNTVLSSFLGGERAIWIGTQTGLVRLNKTAVATFSLPGFADADFGTIYPDRDGSLWVGSSHLFHLTARNAQIVNFSPSLANVRIRTVFRDSRGILWLGTEGKGAFRWDGKALKQLPGVQPYIRAFAEDHAGDVWIGTDGGYVRWTPEGLRYFETHESVRALLVDRSGNLWVGKDRGLTRLRNGSFAPDAPIAPLQSQKVWAIHEDPEGGLWFGTRSSGLFSWKRGRLTSYTTAQGLSSNSVFQILEDRRGTFWISGPNGVSSISRSDLETTARDASHPPAVKLYGTSDGFETTQMYGGVQPAGCISSSGEIWFPSTAGPVRIGADPDEPQSAPPAVIYRLTADGRDVRASGLANLPPGQGKLEIQYGAIQLRSQDRVRFRYQLEGFDHGWTETRARRVLYASIPPGTYRFRLLAFDMARPQFASEAAIALRWRPHVYQTTWFFLLCAGCLCAGVWGIHKLRMRQAHERFAAVLEERNRLAREMHDTLIQGCTSVSALLEAIASIKNGRSDSSDELLNCARLQITETADEARRAVWNLRQSTSKDPELAELLQRMTRQASSGSSVPVHFEACGRPRVLDPVVEHDIVMIAREAVHNAVHHADPKEVRLKIDFAPRGVALRISDDGCGFNPEEVFSSADEHFGLLGMRERTQRLGGRFEVRSEKGKGTEVSVNIPVRAA